MESEVALFRGCVLQGPIDLAALRGEARHRGESTGARREKSSAAMSSGDASRRRSCRSGSSRGPTVPASEFCGERLIGKPRMSRVAADAMDIEHCQGQSLAAVHSSAAVQQDFPTAPPSGEQACIPTIPRFSRRIRDIFRFHLTPVFWSPPRNGIPVGTVQSTNFLEGRMKPMPTMMTLNCFSLHRWVHAENKPARAAEDCCSREWRGHHGRRAGPHVQRDRRDAGRVRQRQAAGTVSRHDDPEEAHPSAGDGKLQDKPEIVRAIAAAAIPSYSITTSHDVVANRDRRPMCTYYR